MKIFANSSAEGIKASMFYLEFINTIQTTAFSYHANYAFSVYGDCLFIGIQDLAIICQVWYYHRADTSTLEMALVTLGFTLYTCVLFSGSPLLTHTIWELIMSSSVLLFILSNGSQALQNCKSRSTGQLSLITFLLAFVGSIMRFYTVCVEASDDLVYVSNSVSSIILNSLFMV